MKRHKRVLSCSTTQVAVQRGLLQTTGVFARSWRLLLLWCMAIILLVYGYSLRFELTNFDDQALTGNPILLRCSEFPRVFSEAGSDGALYRRAIRYNPVYGNAYINLLVIAINHGNTTEFLRIMGEVRNAGMDRTTARPDLLHLIQSPC